MIHLQQALAQHWHLSASQYWQLRVLCTLMIGPLLGIICLLLFRRRNKVAAGAQSPRGAALRRGNRLPLQRAAHS